MINEETASVRHRRLRKLCKWEQVAFLLNWPVCTFITRSDALSSLRQIYESTCNIGPLDATRILLQRRDHCWKELLEEGLRECARKKRQPGNQSTFACSKTDEYICQFNFNLDLTLAIPVCIIFSDLGHRGVTEHLKFKGLRTRRGSVIREWTLGWCFSSCEAVRGPCWPEGRAGSRYSPSRVRVRRLQD